jgi:hypothetical protein
VPTHRQDSWTLLTVSATPFVPGFYGFSCATEPTQSGARYPTLLSGCACYRTGLGRLDSRRTWRATGRRYIAVSTLKVARARQPACASSPRLQAFAPPLLLPSRAARRALALRSLSFCTCGRMAPPLGRQIGTSNMGSFHPFSSSDLTLLRGGRAAAIPDRSLKSVVENPTERFTLPRRLAAVV